MKCHHNNFACQLHIQVTYFSNALSKLFILFYLHLTHFLWLFILIPFYTPLTHFLWLYLWLFHLLFYCGITVDSFLLPYFNFYYNKTSYICYLLYKCHFYNCYINYLNSINCFFKCFQQMHQSFLTFQLHFCEAFIISIIHII